MTTLPQRVIDLVDKDPKRYLSLTDYVRDVLASEYPGLATEETTKDHSRETFGGHTFNQYYVQTRKLYMDQVKEGIRENMLRQGGRKKCPDILPLVEYMLQKYDENNRRYTVYGLAQTVRAVLVEKFGVEVATIDATKRHSSHTFDGHTFDEYYRRTLDLHLRKVEEGTRSNDLVDPPALVDDAVNAWFMRSDDKTNLSECLLEEIQNSYPDSVPHGCKFLKDILKVNIDGKTVKSHYEYARKIQKRREEELENETESTQPDSSLNHPPEGNGKQESSLNDKPARREEVPGPVSSRHASDEAPSLSITNGASVDTAASDGTLGSLVGTTKGYDVAALSDDSPPHESNGHHAQGSSLSTLGATEEASVSSPPGTSCQSNNVFDSPESEYPFDDQSLEMEAEPSCETNVNADHSAGLLPLLLPKCVNNGNNADTSDALPSQKLRQLRETKKEKEERIGELTAEKSSLKKDIDKLKSQAKDNAGSATMHDEVRELRAKVASADQRAERAQRMALAARAEKEKVLAEKEAMEIHAGTMEDQVTEYKTLNNSLVEDLARLRAELQDTRSGN